MKNESAQNKKKRNQTEIKNRIRTRISATLASDKHLRNDEIYL